MHNREYPIVPTQQAINGALSIYLDGAKEQNGRQMLFGLSVLHAGTEEQLHAAMRSVEAARGISSVDIHDMLAR